MVKIIKLKKSDLMDDTSELSDLDFDRASASSLAQSGAVSGLGGVVSGLDEHTNNPNPTNDSTTPAQDPQDTSEPEHHEHTGRKLKWWYIALPLVLILGLGAGGYLYKRHQNQLKVATNQNFIESNWHQLSTESEKVSRQIRLGYNKPEDLTTLATSFSDFNLKIKDIEFENDRNSSPDTATKTGVRDLLDAAKSYATDVDSTISVAQKDIKNIDDNTFKTINSTGSMLKTDFTEFRGKNNLGEKISEDIFGIPAYLTEAKDTVVKADADAALAAKKLSDDEAAKAKALADEQDAVKKMATNYLQADVNLNVDAVKATLTTGYDKEYPYDNIKPPRTDSYKPIDFRIVSVTKASEGIYQVTANVTYLSIYQDVTTGQATQTRQTVSEKYRLVYVDGLKNWRLDGISYGGQ